MAAKKSPLAQMKDEHESKEKLVDRVVGLLGQIDKAAGDKDELKARLLAASNKKLLRLFAMATEVKSKYGSVEKLADAAATALGRAKDAPYAERLKKMTPAKLLDLIGAGGKRGAKKAA
jgi:hypothetical protein